MLRCLQKKNPKANSYYCAWETNCEIDSSAELRSPIDKCVLRLLETSVFFVEEEDKRPKVRTKKTLQTIDNSYENFKQTFKLNMK